MTLLYSIGLRRSINVSFKARFGDRVRVRFISLNSPYIWYIETLRYNITPIKNVEYVV